jgi:hypothetical protein
MQAASKVTTDSAAQTEHTTGVVNPPSVVANQSQSTASHSHLAGTSQEVVSPKEIPLTHPKLNAKLAESLSASASSLHQGIPTLTSPLERANLPHP